MEDHDRHVQAPDESHRVKDEARESRAQARDARSEARAQRTRSRHLRERERELRIAEHVSRDRERGHFQPPRARGLTREDIVGAAIAVADAEGTEAVSMRRIARELGTGAMSLYWHVGSKDELRMLMLDAVQADLPEPSGDWRADLAAFAHTARGAVMRHPWAIDYLASGPPVGPNEARNTDRLMAALAGTGLDTETVVRIGMTLATYVAGAVVREAQEIRWHREAAALLATMTASEAERRCAEYVERVGDPERYPYLARLTAEGLDPDAPETRDERFEFGLDCLLDGFAARFGLSQG